MDKNISVHFFFFLVKRKISISLLHVYKYCSEKCLHKQKTNKNENAEKIYISLKKKKKQRTM